jgi:nucleotide-binding universal stress UspA family protein
MTERLLALVDGSDYAESVCHLAAWAAHRLNAPVEALHVLGRREAPGTTDLSGALQLGARTAILTELAELDAQRAKLAHVRGHAILDGAKAILEADGAGPVTVRLGRGDLIEAVTAAEPGLRAIVIGKRGEAANFAVGHLGSNVERVVRAAKVPVLVAARAFRPIERVVIAWDANPSVEAAIARMAASPVFARLELALVHAGAPDARAAAAMEAAAERLRAGGAGKVTTEIVAGEPEAVLERRVTESGADLLAMGAYGGSRIRHLIIGSTTTAMIRACKVPVLLFR